MAPVTPPEESMTAEGLKTELEGLWEGYLALRAERGINAPDDILQGKVDRAIALATSLADKPIPDDVMAEIVKAVDALGGAIEQVTRGDAAETAEDTRTLVTAVAGAELHD